MKEHIKGVNPFKYNIIYGYKLQLVDLSILSSTIPKILLFGIDLIEIG